SPAAALELLGRMRGALGGSISAFELIHVEALAFIAETMPEWPRPPAFDADWIVLMEAADARAAEVPSRLEESLAEAMIAGVALDVLVAQSEAQRRVFWGVREAIPEANRLIGAIASHDVSLPISKIGEFVA